MTEERITWAPGWPKKGPVDHTCLVCKEKRPIMYSTQEGEVICSEECLKKYKEGLYD